jgi:hypothetical protein
MSRAVRDLYADCLSTLPGLLARGEAAAIHFYFANFAGMRRHLFPELAEAYRRWLDSGRLADLGSATAVGLERWRGLAAEMLDLHAELGNRVGPAIEARLSPGLAC